MKQLLQFLLKAPIGPYGPHLSARHYEVHVALPGHKPLSYGTVSFPENPLPLGNGLQSGQYFC